MPDNVTLPGTGNKVASRKVTYSGDSDVDLQAVSLVTVAGSDDAKTATDVARTAAAALPSTEVGTGTNASGQVTVTNSSTTIIAAREGRRGVLLINRQTVNVYIDPSGGTAATTHAELQSGESLYLPVTSAITGITDAAYTAVGDAKVHYIECY